MDMVEACAAAAADKNTAGTAPNKVLQPEFKWCMVPQPAAGRCMREMIEGREFLWQKISGG
jgi:hypothetical protein